MWYSPSQCWVRYCLSMCKDVSWTWMSDIYQYFAFTEHQSYFVKNVLKIFLEETLEVGDKQTNLKLCTFSFLALLSFWYFLLLHVVTFAAGAQPNKMAAPVLMVFDGTAGQWAQVSEGRWTNSIAILSYLDLTTTTAVATIHLEYKFLRELCTVLP